MSIFVQNASAAVARAIKTAGVWVAWGAGDPDWDNVAVPPPVGATGLVDEIGRRRAQTVEFIVPDEDGDIVLPQGTYAASVNPTGQLYVRCNFAATDAPTAFVREAGAFIGCTVSEGDPGTDYFVPADVTSPGVLLMLDRFAKITRNDEFSVSLEFVMTL